MKGESEAIGPPFMVTSVAVAPKDPNAFPVPPAGRDGGERREAKDGAGVGRAARDPIEWEDDDLAAVSTSPRPLLTRGEEGEKEKREAPARRGAHTCRSGSRQQAEMCRRLSREEGGGEAAHEGGEEEWMALFRAEERRKVA